MSSVGNISLDLNVNSRGFNRQVDGIGKQAKKSFGMLSVAVGNIFADMAQRAVGSIGNFVKDSINKGSELSELQNVVDSVFTTMSDKVESFSKNALEAYGLTESQSKKMVGTYGAMSKSFGYSEKQAYAMSTALTALTGDVASFYNLNHDEAYTKLKSVFTGETESLKELGVVMTQAALDQFALANGFGKTTKNMSEQEKVALRLAFVQDKLSVAAGDFTKTQSQWANQTRILSGQFDSLKAAIGEGLINVLTPVIRVINTIMAKLVQLAQAFSSFTAMLMGKQAGGGAGQAMKEVADAASMAAESTGGIEDAASGAEKAAKKAKKSLMGFDEINKLTSNDEAGSGGAGGGGLFEGIEFAEALAEQESKVEATTSKIIDKIKEMLSLFKKGFKSGLGDDFDNSLKRTDEHIKNIRTSLSNIFDDSVFGAFNSFLKKLFYSLGQLSGAVVSIGQTIAETLLGGLDIALRQSSSKIRERLINIFDIKSSIVTKLGDLSEAIASIFEVFRGDTAKQIVADLISIFVEASLGIAELALKIGEDAVNLIATPIINNKDKIKVAIEKLLLPVSSILSTLRKGLEETFNKIFEVYEAKVAPAFALLSESISKLVSAILDAWINHISPAINAITQAFQTSWEEVLQPILNRIVEVIGDVVSAVIIVLSGLIDFITGIFTGDWSLAWSGVRKVFEGFWNIISSIATLSMNILSGIIKVGLEGIKGTFEHVFTGIWNFLKGILNTILGGVERMVNGIIKGINRMIDALNSLKFDIPDWVPGLGGKSFRLHLGKVSEIALPRLAEGGYVRANQPQPVIVGDNKTQGEIISPEGKMLEVVMQALESFFGRLMDAGYQVAGAGEAGDIVIPIYLDGTLLDEVIVTAQQRRNIRSGGR